MADQNITDLGGTGTGHLLNALLGQPQGGYPDPRQLAVQAGQFLTDPRYAMGAIGINTPAGGQVQGLGSMAGGLGGVAGQMFGQRPQGR